MKGNHELAKNQGLKGEELKASATMSTTVDIAKAGITTYVGTVGAEVGAVVGALVPGAAPVTAVLFSTAISSASVWATNWLDNKFKITENTKKLGNNIIKGVSKWKKE